ncbi:MAG: hypothetical protein KDM63_21900, partial [Verrucomicrobiae bacterium]|nr:hypothetical protein [Verrucomicrobiae bacterium]
METEPETAAEQAVSVSSATKLAEVKGAAPEKKAVGPRGMSGARLVAVLPFVILLPLFVALGWAKAERSNSGLMA